MLGGIGLQLGIIFVLMLANGLFAAAEMSLVSAHRSVLHRKAQEGDAGARAALMLVDSPNNFLATVQIGVSFISIFAGAFGGANIERALVPALINLGVPAGYANAAAMIIVVSLITYLTLVIGELVPKRLALRNADGIARLVGRPMYGISRLIAPLVGLLSFSTDILLRLLGSRERREPGATTAEIGYLLETGMRRGEIEPLEAELVQEAFRFTETRARDIMTPRPDIVALADTASLDEVQQAILTSGYSRIPIYRETIDNIIGFVHSRDLLAARAQPGPVSLADLRRLPLFVPETITNAALLKRFREERAHLAIVLDEFGATAGLLSLEDVLEELVGEIEEGHRPEETPIVQRSPTTWLVEGTVSLDDLRKTVEITEWPERDHLGYTTLAGFLLARLGHIPHRGESTEWQGYRFEVVDMDGRRIDQVLVTRLPEEREMDLTSSANKG